MGELAVELYQKTVDFERRHPETSFLAFSTFHTGSRGGVVVVFVLFFLTAVVLL